VSRAQGCLVGKKAITIGGFARGVPKYMTVIVKKEGLIFGREGTEASATYSSGMTVFDNSEKS